MTAFCHRPKVATRALESINFIYICAHMCFIEARFEIKGDIVSRGKKMLSTKRSNRACWEQVVVERETAKLLSDFDGDCICI